MTEREMVSQQIAEMQAQLADQSAGDQPRRLASLSQTLHCVRRRSFATFVVSYLCE